MLSIGKDFAVNWFFTVRWILKDGLAFGFQLDLDLVLVFQSDLDSVWFGFWIWFWFFNRTWICFGLDFAFGFSSVLDVCF